MISRIKYRVRACADVARKRGHLSIIKVVLHYYFIEKQL